MVLKCYWRTCTITTNGGGGGEAGQCKKEEGTGTVTRKSLP